MDIKREPLNLKFLGIYLIMAVASAGSNIAGEMLFPGSNAVPLIVRTVLAILGLVAIGIGSELLLRRQFGRDVSLGLQPSLRSASGFLIGSLGGVVLVLLIAACFWIFAPFHFESGSLTLTQTLPDIHRYFLSNLAEELVFRGYLLILLVRRVGLQIALLLIAVLFGLFHLPGLSGLAALKMILTTAACSYLFVAAFLQTGTIWAAIALHFVANVTLHKITGLSGDAAILKPALHSTYPNFDPGFWILFTLPLLLALPLLTSSTVKARITAISADPASDLR